MVGRRGFSSARLTNLMPCAIMSDDATDVVAEGSRWSVLRGPHIYAVDEVIAAVVDRGLSSYGAKRDELLSAYLDGEALPEDKWCGAIGDRWLQMDLKVGALLAANGTLFSKNMTMFEVKDNALENDTDTCTYQIGLLEVGSLDERVDKLALETQSLQERTKQQFLEIQSLKESTKQLALDIESLQEDNKWKKVKACSSNVVDLLKDFGHVFLRYTPSSKMSAAKRAAIVSVKDHGLDGESFLDGKSNFFRVRDQRLLDAAALSTYDPPDCGYDSRAVLCAKVWMMRELFKQGLPKVRVPAL